MTGKREFAFRGDEVEVEFDFFPGDPGCMYPNDKAYPPEPPSVDIIGARWVSTDGAHDLGQLTDEEFDSFERECHDDFETMVIDDMTEAMWD